MCQSEPNPAIMPLIAGDERYLRLGGGPDKRTPFRAPVGSRAGYTFVGLPDTGLFADQDGSVWWRQAGENVYRMDLGGGGTEPGFTAINGSGATIQAGQPVRVHTDGTLRLAQADSVGNAALALAAEQIAHGAGGQALSLGFLTLADWTFVTGSVSLSPGARYYLTPSALGMLQTPPPTASPDVVQPCGWAVTEQKFLIQTEPAIGL